MPQVFLYWTVTLSLVFHKAISIGYEEVTATVDTFDLDEPPLITPATLLPSGTSSYPGSPDFVPPAGAGSASIFANAGGMDPAIASLGGDSRLGMGTTGPPTHSIGGSAGVEVNTGNVNSRFGESGSGTGVTGLPVAIESAGTADNIGVSSPGVGTTSTIEDSESALGIPGLMHSSGGNLGTGEAGVTGPANLETERTGGLGGVGDSDGSTGSENGNSGFYSSNDSFNGNAAALGSNSAYTVGSVGGHPSSSVLVNSASGMLGSTLSNANAGSSYLGNFGTGGNPGNGMIGGGSGINIHLQPHGLPAAGTGAQSIIAENPTSGTRPTEVGGLTTNPQLISRNPSGAQVNNNPPVVPYNIYATVYVKVVPPNGGTSTASKDSNSNRGRITRFRRPLRNSIRRHRCRRPSPISQRRAKINRIRSQSKSMRITFDEDGRISSIKRI